MTSLIEKAENCFLRSLRLFPRDNLVVHDMVKYRYFLIIRPECHLKRYVLGLEGTSNFVSIASSSTGAHFEIRSIQELRKVHLWVPHGRGISLWLLRSTEALLLKNSPLSLFRLPLVPPVTPRHQPPSEKQLANILSSPSPKMHLISLDLGSGVPQYVVPWPYSGSIATAVPATGSPLSLSCTFFSRCSPNSSFRLFASPWTHSQTVRPACPSLSDYQEVRAIPVFRPPPSPASSPRADRSQSCRC